MAQEERLLFRAASKVVSSQRSRRWYEKWYDVYFTDQRILAVSTNRYTISGFPISGFLAAVGLAVSLSGLPDPLGRYVLTLFLLISAVWTFISYRPLSLARLEKKRKLFEIRREEISSLIARKTSLNLDLKIMTEKGEERSVRISGTNGRIDKIALHYHTLRLVKDGQQERFETLSAQLGRLKWETIALGIGIVPAILIGGIGFGFYLIRLSEVIGLALAIFIISGYAGLALGTMATYYDFRNAFREEDFDHLPTRRARILNIVAIWAFFAVLSIVIVFLSLRT